MNNPVGQNSSKNHELEKHLGSLKRSMLEIKYALAVSTNEMARIAIASGNPAAISAIRDFINSAEYKKLFPDPIPQEQL